MTRKNVTFDGIVTRKKNENILPDAMEVITERSSISLWKSIIIILMVASPIAFSRAAYRMTVYNCAIESISLEDLQKQKYLNRFCSVDKCDFVVVNTDCYNWVYLEIDNPDLSAHVLHSGMFYHDITVYFFDEHMKLIDSALTGYNILIGNKQIRTSSNAIVIPNLKKVKCYIKYKTSIPTGIDFKVSKSVDFINNIADNHTLNGIVNGIFILTIIYSSLFALLLWRRIYVYYLFYVASFWAFMITINYETPLYFSWITLPFTFGFFIVPHYLLTIFLILYSNELLKLKMTLPFISKVNKFIVLILTFCVVSYLIMGWLWQENIMNIFALLPSYIASIILILKKYKPAWFIFLGITLIFLAFFNLSFNLDKYIPLFFIFSIYGIIEIIVFGVSIAYWWKLLSIEKENALKTALASADEITLIKETQNRILEEEVDSKTQALKFANEQLSVYVKQVENQNQYLETDNDKLKVKVIDQIKARSDDKVMNFEDFKINFPDEESCYKYLENIKWAKGFQCFKCNNDKFSSRKFANASPARRCTKCGFVNTLSSYTLYHNIKFPLQKAFYITYMIGTDKSKTLEELSRELDLRMATIHSFLKKVKEARNAYKSKKKNKDGWTHLMLHHLKNNTASKSILKGKE